VFSSWSRYIRANGVHRCWQTIAGQ
jgi:hypothetical protein